MLSVVYSMILILFEITLLFSILLPGLLDRQQSTASTKSIKYERQHSIRRTSIPVPPRKASVSFPDPLFDRAENSREFEGSASTLTRTQLLLSRVAILIFMLCVLAAGILCRLFIPVPNEGQEWIGTNYTTTTAQTMTVDQELISIP